MERKLRTSRAVARGAARPAAPAPAPAPRTAGRTVTGRATVTATASDRHGAYHDETRQEALESITFAPGEPIAEVGVEAGLTINLGDYNSLRVHCSVKIQCPPDRLDEAYEMASDFVTEKVEEEEIKWTGKTTR